MAEGFSPHIEEQPPDPYRGPARTKADEEFEKNIAKGVQAAFVAMGLDGIFTGISFARGAHWRLTGEEKLVMGTHVNNVILAILPPEYLDAYNGILQKFGPIIGAVVPVTAIIGKRLAIDRQIDAIERGASVDPQQTRAGNATDTSGAAQPGFSVHGHAAHSGANGRADTYDRSAHAW